MVLIGAVNIDEQLRGHLAAAAQRIEDWPDHPWAPEILQKERNLQNAGGQYSHMRQYESRIGRIIHGRRKCRRGTGYTVKGQYGHMGQYDYNQVQRLECSGHKSHEGLH